MTTPGVAIRPPTTGESPVRRPAWALRLEGGDRTVVVGVRGAARELASHIGFGVADQTRIATAVSEVARYAVEHVVEATARLFACEGGGRRGIEIEIRGAEWTQSVGTRRPPVAAGAPSPPPDPAEATAAARPRALTYPSTAGAGVPHRSPDPLHAVVAVRALVDELDIEQPPDGGIRVVLRKWLAPDAAAQPEEIPLRQEPHAAGSRPLKATRAQQPAVPAEPPPVHEQRGQEPEAEADGRVAVEAGRVVVFPPSGRGRLPLLRVGPHVRLLINGQEVRRMSVVTATDRIEAQPVHDEPACHVRVEVSANAMQAILHVERVPGARYALLDQPPATELTLAAVAVATLPAPAPSPESIRSALAESGVTYGIDQEALERGLAVESHASLVVARGEAPVPPVDARIELNFPIQPHLEIPAPEEAVRFDPLALHQVSTVQPGQLLAIRHPPRPGRPGRTVTGQPIEVAAPKEAPLRAGPGAFVDPEGNRVYAQRGGRPVFLHGVVAVLPVHVVHGDVSPRTGHVDFDGDVVVRGSVTETLRIRSAAGVFVGGVVSGAEIRAEGDVVVGQGIVRATVVAGSSALEAVELLNEVRSVCRCVRSLVDAARALEGDPRLRRAGPRPRPHGPLVKLLIERKFPALPADVERLLGRLRQHPAGGEEPPLKDLQQATAELYRQLAGAGPLRLRDAGDLWQMAVRIEQAAQPLEMGAPHPADVVTRYVHNSRVEASGRIRLLQGACYYSRLRAGEGLSMEGGVFRGDELVVREGDVRLDEVGSPAGSKVRIEIAGRGTFRARRVHPGVSVTIAGATHLFRSEAGKVSIEPGLGGRLEIHQGA